LRVLFKKQGIKRSEPNAVLRAEFFDAATMVRLDYRAQHAR
jgi:hypothetical protein